MRRLLLAVLLIVLAGCGVSGVPRYGASPPAATKPADPGDTVTKSLRDVERFWTGEFPELSGGKKFRKVQGGYHPYTETEPPPDCGGQPGEYQPNAFYCPDGDYIAWDAQNLIPQLQADFGPLLVGVVFAHEYGHAVQMRLGQTDRPRWCSSSRPTASPGRGWATRWPGTRRPSPRSARSNSTTRWPAC